MGCHSGRGPPRRRGWEGGETSPRAREARGAGSTGTVDVLELDAGEGGLVLGAGGRGGLGSQNDTGGGGRRRPGRGEGTEPAIDSRRTASASTPERLTRRRATAARRAAFRAGGVARA